MTKNEVPMESGGWGSGGGGAGREPPHVVSSFEVTNVQT